MRGFGSRTALRSRRTSLYGDKVTPKRTFLSSRACLAYDAVSKEPMDPYAGKSPNEPFYITTPIYYVNGLPHIGHAYTSVCADAIARFHRSDGRDVFFLTGTDEHGQKVQQSAAKAGLEPQEFADKMSKEFHDLVASLLCAPDRFIRTTEEQHKQTVQELWCRLEERGHIYLGMYEGWYSVRDEAFYDESELVEGKAPTGAPVEWVKEESYFFRLSQFTQPLLDLYASNPHFILPRSKLNEMAAFVRQPGGLRDLSISRTNFSWGIPVPGNPRHVVYVWIDALANYLTAVGYPDSDPANYAKYWPANLQIVGKDILRFHTIYWPALLMAAGLPIPMKVFAHGWWTKDGVKMSKSIGNVVCPNELIKTFGPDALRYFLLSYISFGKDGNYNEEEFVTEVNAVLANDIGNLVSRVLSMIHSNCDGVVPVPGSVLTGKDRIVLHTSVAALLHSRLHIQNLNLKGFVDEVVSVARACNRYMHENEPWVARKKNFARFQTIMFVMVNCLRRLGVLLEPIVPGMSVKILDQCGIPAQLRTFKSIGSREVAGLRLGPLIPVFPRYMNLIEEQVCNSVKGITEENMSRTLKKRVAKAAAKSGEPCVVDSISKALEQAQAKAQAHSMDRVREKAAELPQIIESAEESNARHKKIQSIEDAITVVGNRVRTLKAEGTDKATLKPHVDELLELKRELAKLRI